jgi:tetratricopeptide (TPR) repeat protein
VDGPSVVHAASEIFRQRNFSQAVAACREALHEHPDDVDLRLLLGRSLMALRRDAEAQLEVAYCLKLRPRCPEAYQLLGELAFRRDELNAAEIFFREALRLQGRDVHTQVLLDVVHSLRLQSKTRTRPAAAAAKLPAASAAAGHFSPSTGSGKAGQGPPVPTHSVADDAPTIEKPPEKLRRKRVALGSDPGIQSDREAIARAPGPEQVALKVAGREGGFGEYLVHMGVLTRAQLFAVLHRHYHEKLRIGDACVKLGFARQREIAHHLAAYHERS